MPKVSPSCSDGGQKQTEDDTTGTSLPKGTLINLQASNLATEINKLQLNQATFNACCIALRHLSFKMQAKSKFFLQKNKKSFKRDVRTKTEKPSQGLAEPSQLQLGCGCGRNWIPLTRFLPTNNKIYQARKQNIYCGCQVWHNSN